MTLFIRHKAETALPLVALLVGAVSTWYIYSLGLTKILVDENAHLNVARQVVDSMTPGISQIGFWPPLIHVVMIPFVSIDMLYRTGLAGAFALIPFLMLGAYFLFRLIHLFTKNSFV